MSRLKKMTSLLLAFVMVISMGIVSIESVSAAIDDNGAYVPDESVTCGTHRYYFAMPKEWYNEYTDTAGVYWWDGSDLCGIREGTEYLKWPGYKVHLGDYASDSYTLYYFDCPKDVPIIIWNNYINGGTDEESDIYQKSCQANDAPTEFYSDGDSDLYTTEFFALMEESYNGDKSELGEFADNFFYDEEYDLGFCFNMDNMIFVVPNEPNGETIGGKPEYVGDWYFYYGNGEYGTYPTKERSIEKGTYATLAESNADVEDVTDATVPDSTTATENTTLPDNTCNEIYFDVKASGWDNYNYVKKVYCHIWRADGTGDWPAWQSKRELCSYDKNTGIATYDLSKTSNTISPSDGRIYCVIFSANTGVQTYNAIMSGSCIGDTLYCNGELLENPEDSEKTATVAVWKNNPDCGPEKKITSTGKIVGTAYPDGESDTTLVAQYLIQYYNDSAKTDLTQSIIEELGVDPIDVYAVAKERLGSDPDGRLPYIEKVLSEYIEDIPVPDLCYTVINMGVGETSRVRIWRPSPSIMVPGGNNYTVEDASSYKFTSSNTSVATVDSQGYVKGKSAGTAIITVTNEEGGSSECTIKVKQAPTSVKINPSSLTVGKGDVITISAITNSGSWSTDFTWSSSNTNVVKVSESPIANRNSIRAVGTGTATVTVKTYNGKTATCKVTVKNAPTSVKLSQSSVTLGVGESFTISESTNSGSYAHVDHITWSTSDSEVVFIEKLSGNKATLKAMGAGTATVKVHIYSGVEATCKVTVKPAPTSVTLDSSSIILGKGETYTIKEVTNSGSYANSANLKWSSTNTSVATVTKGSSNKATITAKGNGTAYIKITLYNGKTAQCKVTVKNAPTSVKTNPTSVILGVGETYTISESTNSGSYANASNLKWSSTNTKVATVTKGSNNKATITAKGVGTAYVKITLYNGKTAQCKVTVKSAPTSVKLSKTSITLSKGATYTISESTNSGSYANAANLKWSSTNTSIATVKKGSGNKAVITAKSKGTAYIKITLYNGKTATCKVTVK